jgi:protein tyrosine phosphatase (PTP) superfamily phosphohydrolase (DUF442 family)
MASRDSTKSRKRRLLRWVGLAGLLAGLAGGGWWAYLRLLRGNFHTVVAGRVYRSAQPSPRRLAEWTRRYKLKTVINLRGASGQPFHAAEQRAAERLGLTMIDIRLSATEPPSALWLRRLVAALETASPPILLHCRDGADRTGVASVLAAMALGGQRWDQARSQLSAKYLHVNPWTNRIAELLERYESWCRQRRLDTAGWAQFREWALRDYHPAWYRVEIVAPERLTVVRGRRAAVDVRVINRAQEAIPAGDEPKTFNLAVFTGSSTDDSPDRELGPRTPLPKRDIPPGGEVSVRQTVIAPWRPGTYNIHFDLVEEHRTWFARQGSPVPTCTLVVAPR